MTTTTIPCKRPKVDLVPFVPNPDLSLTRCLVPTCDWEYGPALKTDAQEQVTRHRRTHRDAVPTTEVIGPTVNLNFAGRCACGWRTAIGVSTRTDVEAMIASHLSTEHGLVTC